MVVEETTIDAECALQRCIAFYAAQGVDGDETRAEVGVGEERADRSGCCCVCEPRVTSVSVCMRTRVTSKAAASVADERPRKKKTYR